MISPRKLHRWFALGIMLPGLVLLLSGAGLSFAKEIDRFMRPSLLSVAASGEIELANVHSIIVAQLQLQPQWTLRQIRYPQSPYDPITLGIYANETSSLIYLNPHTGKVLGQRPQANELVERLRRLHVELISPSIGQLLAVIVAGVLVLMIVLGISMARRGGRWQLSSWHVRLGVFVAPILLAIAGSGIYSAYGPSELRPAVERLGSSDLTETVPLSFLTVPDTELASICRQQLVSVTVVDDGLSLRCEDGAVFSLPAYAAMQDRQLNSGSGRVLWNLHSGEWAGLAGRGIWMWSVLAVLYLLYSGVRDWRHRKITKS